MFEAAHKLHQTSSTSKQGETSISLDVEWRVSQMALTEHGIAGMSKEKYRSTSIHAVQRERQYLKNQFRGKVSSLLWKAGVLL